MSAQSSLLPTGSILKNRWKVQNRIGAGAFGEIYSAVDMFTGEEVAVKTEPSDTQKYVLKTEAHVMRRLQKSKHVVRYILDGQTEFFYFLVMERLGENLADLRRKTLKGRFSLPTTLRLGIQMLDALEDVHNLGFLHRDVKPSNFVIGRKSADKIFLIDFGLSRKYTTHSGTVRPPRKNCGFRGTARYASINAHAGKELSRRDDLWSVFYLLVEFAVGSLPWRKIKDKKVIADMKAKCTNAELVKNLPLEFSLFLKHLLELNYNDDPDYNYLRGLLARAYNRENYQADLPFDWQIVREVAPHHSGNHHHHHHHHVNVHKPKDSNLESAGGTTLANAQQIQLQLQQQQQQQQVVQQNSVAEESGADKKKNKDSPRLPLCSYGSEKEEKINVKCKCLVM